MTFHYLFFQPRADSQQTIGLHDDFWRFARMKSSKVTKIWPLRNRDYDHESPREKAANQFTANALIPDSDWKTVPKVRLSAIVIQRTCFIWAESRGYNKWIALGHLSYQTGMYKFKTAATRSIS